MDFFNGLNYLLQGFKLIFRRELRRFVLTPLVINIGMFALLFLLAFYRFHDFVSWVQHFLPAWLHWLEWLLWIAAVLLFLLFWVYFSTVLVNAVSGPFNTLLSEKVSSLYVSRVPSTRSFLIEMPLAIKREGQLVLYYIPRALFFLLLFFIPVIQFFAAIFWYAFTSWVMSMQYLDYPMDNHRIDVAQMKRLMKEKVLLNIGFGSGIIVLTMIPFVNFLIVPTAVAGATLLWVKEYLPDLSRSLDEIQGS